MDPINTDGLDDLVKGSHYSDHSFKGIGDGGRRRKGEKAPTNFSAHKISHQNRSS